LDRDPVIDRALSSDLVKVLDFTLGLTHDRPLGEYLARELTRARALAFAVTRDPEMARALSRDFADAVDSALDLVEVPDLALDRALRRVLIDVPS
jgi:hypothetical protein